MRKRTKAFVAGGMGLVGLGLGLGLSESGGTTPSPTAHFAAANSSCEVIDNSGNPVYPIAYPLGRIVVKFDFQSWTVENSNAQQNYAQTVEKVEGTIIKDKDGYEIIARDIPDGGNLTDEQFFEFAGTGADLQINTPQTGVLGILKSCVTYGIGTNNIPTEYIQLPTEANK